MAVIRLACKCHKTSQKKNKTHTPPTKMALSGASLCCRSSLQRIGLFQHNWKATGHYFPNTYLQSRWTCVRYSLFDHCVYCCGTSVLIMLISHPKSQFILMTSYFSNDPGCPRVDSTKPRTPAKASVDMCRQDCRWQMSNMRISSKGNFRDFTNSIALLLKVKLRLICIYIVNKCLTGIMHPYIIKHPLSG